MLKKITVYSCLAVSLLLVCHTRDCQALTWQEVLQQAGFDISDTFDELQDWTPGGQWYSGAGCCTTELPKKIDGSGSIWSLWNNKGLSFEYTPGNGAFTVGDLITGATSGTTATVRQVWNLDGKSYIQLTYDNTYQGSSGFQAGENISSGSKSGSNVQWPLFIADHGPDHTWRQTGKSLVLDLGDNDNSDPVNPTMAGLGAQRMAAFFGNGVSGKSGYKKIHAFFMMRVAPTFFNRCLTPGTGCVDDGYDPVSVVKVFDLDSGFTGVSQWGTPAERAQVSTNPLTANRLPEYGLNFSIFNFNGGGLTYPRNLFFTENNYVTSGSSPNYAYTQVVASKPVRSGTSLDVESFVGSAEWFGIEAASDIGTVGGSNGSTDFWIYDKSGVELGHYVATGQNRLVNFDHYYNKFVLGGNRLSGNGKTGGIDVRWWIDDVIIDGSRIGPAYFQLFPKVTSFSAPTTSNSYTVGNLSLQGSSPLGEAAVSYLITENNRMPAPDAGGWSGSVPQSYTVTSDGVHELFAWAKDSVGNVSFPVASKTVLVDTTPPVLTLSPVTTPTLLSSQSLSGTVSDVGVGGVSLSIRVGDAAAQPLAITGNTWKFTPAMLSVSTTPTTIAITARDAAGNQSQQVTASITRVLAGDADGDGAVGVEDALWAMQVWAGLKSPDASQRLRVDVAPIVGGVPQPNGVVDTGDAVAILGIIVGNNAF